jgi:hypothetical protein
MAMVMNHHEELMRGMRVALWLTMLAVILLILIVHLVLAAVAGPLSSQDTLTASDRAIPFSLAVPVLRPPLGGSCPFGYVTSGSYCAPSQGAQVAIPKPPNGSCPWGWSSSGSFCLRSGDR